MKEGEKEREKEHFWQFTSGFENPFDRRGEPCPEFLENRRLYQESLSRNPAAARLMRRCEILKHNSTFQLRIRKRLLELGAVPFDIPPFEMRGDLAWGAFSGTGMDVRTDLRHLTNLLFVAETEAGKTNLYLRLGSQILELDKAQRIGKWFFDLSKREALKLVSAADAAGRPIHVCDEEALRRLRPYRPPSSVGTPKWMSVQARLLVEALRMEDAEASQEYLETLLATLYKESPRGDFTHSDVFERIQRTPSSPKSIQTGLLRRFEKLARFEQGRKGGSLLLERLYDKNVVFVLDRISNREVQTYYASTLVANAFTHYVESGITNAGPRTLVFIDEAWKILADDRHYLCQKFREIRGAGVIALVFTQPGIPDTVRSNTPIKILGPTGLASETMEIARGAMGCTNDQVAWYLKHARAGLYLAKINKQPWTLPFAMEVPERTIPMPSRARLQAALASLETVAFAWEQGPQTVPVATGGRFIGPPRHRPAPPRPGPAGAAAVQTPAPSPMPALGEIESRLLRDVLDHPLCGTVERYGRLGLSGYIGNKSKKALLDKHMIRQRSLSRSKGGPILLLDLLPAGLAFLRQPSTAGAGRGSRLHQQFCAAIARKMQAKGYRLVGIDRKLSLGYCPDLQLERPGETTVVEIALSDDDREVEHVLKAFQAGARQVIVAADTATNAARLRKKLEAHPGYKSRGGTSFCFVADAI